MYDFYSRTIPTKSGVHYLPHQHIKDRQTLLVQTLKSTTDFSGMLTMISGNEKPKKQSSVNIVDALVAGGRNDLENNSNLSLFGSPTSALTSAKTNEKNCIVCLPPGLTTSTLNLSSIGPLCNNIGCIGAVNSNSKNLNSNDRMSRSASPAGENPRLYSIKIGDFSYF